MLMDPRAEHKPFTDAAYVNPPTNAVSQYALLHYVDIAIECNNKGAHSVTLMWWTLVQEVLHIHGTICLQEVVPDLCSYRDPVKTETENHNAGKSCGQRIISGWMDYSSS